MTFPVGVGRIILSALLAAVMLPTAAQTNGGPVMTDDASTAAPDAPNEHHDTALERRNKLERDSELNPFVMTPHYPNYVLPFAYHDSPNQASTMGRDLSQRLEMKMQISFKFPAWQNVLGSGGHLYFAYTGRSFWQAYDQDRSRPFRETNHEPEAFLSFDPNWKVFGTRLDRVYLGVSHQSNGGSTRNSRSWNRIYASFIWELDDLMVSIKPWWRIPERAKKGPDDPTGDDNPEIQRFAGQFETVVAWSRGRDTYSAVWKNNARAKNRGSIELSWSFPMTARARGYVQYFSGYAESLIDFDQHHQRLGIGVLLTDWL